MTITLNPAAIPAHRAIADDPAEFGMVLGALGFPEMVRRPSGYAGPHYVTELRLPGGRVVVVRTFHEDGDRVEVDVADAAGNGTMRRLSGQSSLRAAASLLQDLVG